VEIDNDVKPTVSDQPKRTNNSHIEILKIRDTPQTLNDPPDDDDKIPNWVIEDLKKTPRVHFNETGRHQKSANVDTQPPSIIAFSEIKPPSAFSGEKESRDYLAWWSQLQAFYDQKPMTEQQKVRYLLGCLTGIAREVLDPHMHLNTVAELKEKLDDCFNPLANPLLRLEALTHERHQTVRVFAARVRAAVFHYLESTSHSRYDDTCISYFLKKLRPEFGVNFKTRPATWIEAVKIASDTESELQLKFSNTKSENLMAVGRSTTKDREETKLLRDEVLFLRKQLKRVGTPQFATTPERVLSAEDTHYLPPDTSQKRQCYFCGSFAHTYRLCPKATAREIAAISERLDKQRQYNRRNFHHGRTDYRPPPNSNFKNDFNSRKFDRRDHSNNDRLNSSRVTSTDSTKPLKRAKESA
jgi:hypothetical protein